MQFSAPETILMCPPDHFSIDYEINPWMHVDVRADRALAQQQWKVLYETIKKCGATVELIDAVKGLPDLVFTANAALFDNNSQLSYVSRFKCDERKGEEKHFRAFFERLAGCEIANEPAKYLANDGSYVGPSFEGAGDALFLTPSHLVCAHGFRTDSDFYDHFQELFPTVKKLTLDTCFCPLPTGSGRTSALWFPDAFVPESQQVIRDLVDDLLEVPEEDAKHFACNAVVIGRNVVIPAGCKATRRLLEARGFTVHECAMTEFIKSGGACKCLTLNITPLHKEIMEGA